MSGPITFLVARNLIEINYLNLMMLMQVEPGTEFKVERPQVIIPPDANPDAMAFREVYNTAVGTQPQIRANELRLRSAELDVDIARGALLPTLTAFGGIDTRWSSAAKVIDQVNDVLVTQKVVFNGIEEEIQFQSQEFTFKDNPYFDQLDQNFGQSIGLSLQVPIYNNGRNRINVQRAQVGILNAKVQSDLTKQQLKNDVQAAIANARAGRLILEASERATDAAQIAFENAEKRFQLGAIDYVGVSNLFTFMNTIPPYWKPYLDMMYEMVGNPEKDKDTMYAASPIFHINKIKTPLFVVQGANDPRVNIDESDQIVSALRKHGVDVLYMVKYDEGHGFHNEENRFEFYKAMLGFLDKYLKK